MTGKIPEINLGTEIMIFELVEHSDGEVYEFSNEIIFGAYHLYGSECLIFEATGILNRNIKELKERLNSNQILQAFNLINSAYNFYGNYKKAIKNLTLDGFELEQELEHSDNTYAKHKCVFSTITEPESFNFYQELPKFVQCDNYWENELLIRNEINKLIEIKDKLIDSFREVVL